jgi:ABC-type polysaccharide/polyol phosphate export permease
MLAGPRRAGHVSVAFLRMDWLMTRAYPMAFVFLELQNLVPVVIYYFVAELVGVGGPKVGYDYYTFVVLGMLGTQFISAGLLGLGSALVRAVQEGRFEMLLIEPVKWRLLPFALVQWPIVLQAGGAVATIAVAAILGAQFRLAGLPAAVIVLGLGTAAGIGLSVLASSVRVLAKQGDPVLGVYVILTQIFSGVYFPVSSLPPAIRPLAALLPNTYVIDSLRRVMMPAGANLPGPRLAVSVVALMIFNLALFPIAIWLFGRSMQYGRKMGVLGGY